MAKKTKIDTKQRILDTAIDLFAESSFAEVGVREIAKKAGVSVSMISYHFDGKKGVLIHVLNKFMKEYRIMLEGAYEQDGTAHKNVENIIRGVLGLLKHHMKLCRIAYFVLPRIDYDIKVTELEEFKTLIETSEQIYSKVGLDVDNKRLFSILISFMGDAIFAHFFSRPFIEETLDFELDDAYNEYYIKMTSQLFMNGINGLIELQNDEEK